MLARSNPACQHTFQKTDVIGKGGYAVRGTELLGEVRNMRTVHHHDSGISQREIDPSDRVERKDFRS